MNYEKRDLVRLIQNTVYEITEIQLDSEKVNLLDVDICPVDFLYIFDTLERKLHVPAVNILIGQTYQVLEIDAMSEALLELLR